jgi:hypothetical protein
MHQISPPQCKHILSNTFLSLFAMECTHAWFFLGAKLEIILVLWSSLGSRNNCISLPLCHKKMALPDYDGIAWFFWGAKLEIILVLWSSLRSRNNCGPNISFSSIFFFLIFYDLIDQFFIVRLTTIRKA